MSPDNQLPDPTAGGRYERNRDGSLKQIHATEEAAPRVKRDPSEPDEANANTPAQPTNTDVAGDRAALKE
jgi:hypothetical protein